MTRWLLLIGCGVLATAGWLRVRPVDKARAEPTAASVDVPYRDAEWIHYSTGFARRNELKFAEVAMGSLSPVVRATGTVSYDPDLVAIIGARVSGRVHRVFKAEGDEVRSGDVLAEIDSAELRRAQAGVVAARARAGAALSHARGERELAETKLGSRRAAELAAASAASARAELAAAESQVQAFGGTLGDEPGILLLQSPIAGKVVMRDLSLGQHVDPASSAFKVADLRRVFVDLAVFERDVSALHAGDRVEVFVPGSGETAISGSVVHVSDEVDFASKTASIRAIVDKPASPLRPGQAVSAKVHLAARKPSIVVRRDAVTSVDGNPTVFVEHDATSVEQRIVELGRQDGPKVEIIRGLAQGERIAVNGVSALESELFR